jgi:hypothetical protein
LQPGFLGGMIKIKGKADLLHPEQAGE